MKKLLILFMLLCVVTTASAESYEDSADTWSNGLVTCLIAGIVIGGISVGVMAYNMKSVRDRDSASDYVEKEGLDLQVRQDRFLYHTVSRRPRPKQNNRN